MFVATCVKLFKVAADLGDKIRSDDGRDPCVVAGSDGRRT